MLDSKRAGSGFVTPPPGDVTAPSGDVTASPGDVRAPRRDVTAPPRDETALPDNAVAPPRDLEVVSGVSDTFSMIHDSNVLEGFHSPNQYELLSEASITDVEDSSGWIPEFRNNAHSRRHRPQYCSSPKASKINVVIGMGQDSSSTAYKPLNQVKVIIGKGPISSVQAECFRQKESSDRDTNKIVTGVFVSRFKPQMTAAQVDRYVQLHFGENVKSEKLRTRFNTYSSFYIRADRKLRELFLNSQAEQIWSSGLLVKPFS
jgi:hypothetical protein